MNAQTQSKFSSLFHNFSESITLAFITGGLYAVAFSYEAGYLGYFEIPTHLVRPSITTLVLSVFACVTALLSAIKFLNLITPLLNILISDKHAKWRYVILVNTIILLPILFILSIYPWSLNLFKLILVGLVFSNIFFIGIPVALNFFFKTEPTFDLAIEKSYQNDPLDITQWIIKRGALPHLIWFIVFIVAIGLGWAVGNSKAIKEETFDVLVDSEPMIMIRSYDQYILFKPIDINNKSFDKRFRIVPITNINQDFEHTKIGKLELQKGLR